MPIVFFKDFCNATQLWCSILQSRWFLSNALLKWEGQDVRPCDGHEDFPWQDR